MTRPVARLTLALLVAVAAVAAVPAVSVPAGPQDGPDAQAPWFRQDAAAFGLEGVRAHRAIAVDLDGDGWSDLLINELGGNHGDRLPRILMNRAADDGRTFVDRTEQSGINRDPAGPDDMRDATTFCVADVNHDGVPDLYSGVDLDLESPKVDPETRRPMTDEEGNPIPANEDPGFRSAILLGNGDGTFRLVHGSGIERPERVIAPLFLDYDRDGHLDLFTGSWYRYYGLSYEGHPDRLYRGNGDGTFEEVTEEAGLLGVPQHGRRDSRRPTYGATHGDWDLDGWEDIWTASYGRQWNRLWRNNGDGTFTDVAEWANFDGDSITVDPGGGPRREEPPFRANGNTFDIALRDFDNDGDLDAFLSEITHAWAGVTSDLSCLLVNRGEAGGFAFTRELRRVPQRSREGNRWNQGDIHAGWFDLDNDMRADLILSSSDYPDGQYLRIYRQKADHTFEEVTDRCGIEWMNSAQPTVTDLDRDGRQDIVVGNSNMRLTREQRESRPLQLAVWHNLHPDAGNWIQLRLEAPAGGTAVGARVEVVAGGVTQTQWLRTGSGHAGHQNDPVLHFGLADHDTCTVTVRLPDRDGTVRELGVLRAGERYVVPADGPAAVDPRR